jgi:hypothetical protein
MHQEKRNVCRVLVGKLEGRRAVRRPRCRWEHDMEMDLRSNRMRWYGWD